MIARAAVALLAALLLGTLPLHAQRVDTAIEPRTGTVGDLFHVIVTIDVRTGERLALPDSLMLPADLETAGRPSLQESELADGGRRIVASYPLTGWRPGTHAIPRAALRLVTDGRSQTIPLDFPDLEIASVLPADTAGIEPMGVRDVVGGSRVLWPWILAAIALLLAMLALAYWLRRRRRPGEDAAAVRITAAERALDRLDSRRGIVLAQGGAFYTLYDELAQALREYLTAVEPTIGEDLTSTEVAALAPARLEQDAAPLAALLGGADLVKFARAAPTPDRALRDWADARAWVQRVDEVRRAREQAAAEAARAAAAREAA
jgi:hypothetical protein